MFSWSMQEMFVYLVFLMKLLYFSYLSRPTRTKLARFPLNRIPAYREEIVQCLEEIVQFGLKKMGNILQFHYTLR